jgi:hypothetical protein
MSKFHHDVREVALYDNRPNSPTKGRTLLVKVSVDIDLNKVARELGRKALANKSRKSRLALGITAEYLSARTAGE